MSEQAHPAETTRHEPSIEATERLPLLATTTAIDGGSPIDVPSEPVLAPRIEIPGMEIEHLDHSPAAMNVAIDKLLAEANLRTEHGDPHDMYDEISLGDDRSVVLEIRKKDEFEHNGSNKVASIELKFRDATGGGFEYWLADDGLVMMFDKPDGGEKTVDLFNDHRGGARQYEDGLSIEMQEHAASAVATMDAMMQWAGMDFLTAFHQRGVH